MAVEAEHRESVTSGLVHPRLFGRLRVRVAALVLLASTAVFVGGVVVEARIVQLAAELSILVGDFERTIGYGGLIHNFKNHVLRPGEPEFREQALANAAQALLLIDEIEDRLTRLDPALSFEAQRESLDHYKSRITIVDRLAAEGRSAQEIDSVVRYSDGPALQELHSIHATVQGMLFRRLNLLRWGGAAMFAVALGSLLAMVAASAGESRAAKASEVVALRRAKEEHAAFEQADIARRLAEATNEELHAFSYAVSHDLKGPSNTLMLLLSEIRHQPLNPDQARLVDMCIGTVERMRSLISDLLGYAGVIGVEPEIVAVPLDSVLTEVVADLKADMIASGARVDVAPLPVVRGTASHMRELFQNLIHNAIKYRKPGVAPEISVEAGSEAPGWVEIRVADNGVGIEKKHQDRIFEMFQRLHRYDEVPGTGLGLTLCRRIALNMGGRITVESEPGVGSVFTVSLPLAEENES